MWVIALFLFRFAAFQAIPLVIGVWTALPKSVRQIILLLVALGVVYWVAYARGEQNVRTQWNAAIARDVERNAAIGEKANADAENSIPEVTPADRAADAAIAPRVAPCRVLDRFDRSCAGR